MPASAADIPDVVSLLNRAYRGNSDERGWTSEAGLISGGRVRGCASGPGDVGAENLVADDHGWHTAH